MARNKIVNQLAYLRTINLASSNKQIKSEAARKGIKLTDNSIYNARSLRRKQLKLEPKAPLPLIVKTVAKIRKRAKTVDSLFNEAVDRAVERKLNAKFQALISSLTAVLGS